MGLGWQFRTVTGKEANIVRSCRSFSCGWSQLILNFGDALHPIGLVVPAFKVRERGLLWTLGSPRLGSRWCSARLLAW